jgi:hypothetical protein
MMCLFFLSDSHFGSDKFVFLLSDCCVQRTLLVPSQRPEQSSVILWPVRFAIAWFQPGCFFSLSSQARPSSLICFFLFP